MEEGISVTFFLAIQQTGLGKVQAQQETGARDCAPEVRVE